MKHDEQLLATVIERSVTYEEAGADGLFVPGLATILLISRLATETFETSVLQHAYLILRFSRH